jgi:hypothetical protein
MKDVINKRFINAVEAILDRKISKNKAEIVRNIGIKYGNFAEIMGKRQNASAEIISIFCKKYKVRLEFILYGDGDMFEDKKQSFPEGQPVPYEKAEKCEQCKQCVEKDKLIQTLQSAINVQNKYIECLEDKNPGAREKKSKKDTTTIPYISTNI